MFQIWTYTIVSIFFVSIVSLVGAVALGISEQKLKKILLPLVSFSAGALLGDVFLHMLPEMAENGFSTSLGRYMLAGILIFFILEKFIFYHLPHSEHSEQVHSYTYLSLISDGLHNFIDGAIIAASFLTDIRLGIATTIAVVLHEIPQELGNFAILVHGGMKKSQALLYNFLSALTAFFGGLIILTIFKNMQSPPQYLLAISASSFIYIAMSDLIPELSGGKNKKTSGLLLAWFVLGILSMSLLLLLEI